RDIIRTTRGENNPASVSQFYSDRAAIRIAIRPAPLFQRYRFSLYTGIFYNHTMDEIPAACAKHREISPVIANGDMAAIPCNIKVWCTARTNCHYTKYDGDNPPDTPTQVPKA